MVSIRNRSSLGTEGSGSTSTTTPTSTTTNTSTLSTTPATRPSKRFTEEWTTKEKLCLASLAIKHGNSWNSVARNMQSFVEKDRPEGWSNQKNCAAQFDKLMNELGVDKRPKRNEPSDGNSSSVIYKKMVEKRIKELEDNIIEMRKLWLDANNDIESCENGTLSSDRSDQLKQKVKPAQTGSKTTGRQSTSLASTEQTTDKPPTRALTRRESSRLNLEKTLAVLCKEASEIKAMNLMSKPSEPSEREFYDKVILKHIDLSIIKKRLGGEVDDPHAVMNDLLLMFQNMTMFYSPDHPIHKNAIELRERLVPQWEKALLDRFKTKH